MDAAYDLLKLDLCVTLYEQMRDRVNVKRRDAQRTGAFRNDLGIG
ncbi:MAG: hypothetical protein ACT4OT_04600 [Acidobacteriota bacterium]